MRKSEKVGLIIIFLLAVCGAIYSFHNFYRAFPQINIPINVKKAQASAQLDSLLTEFGADPEKFKSVILMASSPDAMIYADKEFSRDTLLALFQKPGIPFWYWHKRYFVPLQKEEFAIGIRPDDGKLAYFRHTIPETLSGADLPEDSARAIADSFLASLGYSTEEFELEKSSSEKRPNRRDYWFTYQRKDWSLGEAKEWIEIGVWGDKVGKFSHFLHIPEEWMRQYEKNRSENHLFQNVAQFFAVVVVLLMLGYLLHSFRRRDLAIKFGLAFGLVGFFADAAMQLNMFPILLEGYPTTSSFTGFVLNQIIGAIVNGALTGVIIFIAAVAGERIYREYLPDSYYLPDLFSPSGWRTKRFATGVLVGYLFALAHIGFVVFYYVFGRKIGIWAPPDTNYSNLMSSYLPWVFALGIGVTASLSEDFMFRMFGVPYFSKLFKSRVVGVILPALIWGFLHSNYPQEPGWARGVEVGLIGIAAGVIMLKYSIVANITWHFLIDAGLTSLIIFNQGDTLNIIFAAIVLIFPAALVGVGYLFGTERELAKNRDKITPVQRTVAKKPPEIPLSYGGIPRRKKIVWGIIGLAGLIIAALAPNYPHQSVEITRTQAEKIAKECLIKENIPPDSFRVVTYFSQAPAEKELLYPYQQCGWACVESLYGEGKWEPLYYWRVRFFIPEKKEEYNLCIRPGGEIQSLSHSLEESDSGASIPQDSAFALAKDFLRRYGKGEILNWELISKTTQKRPARTDHYFTWQSPDSIGQAHKRLSVEVLGDRPSTGVLFLKCPEEWDRWRSKRTAWTVLQGLIQFLIYAAIVILIIIALVKAVGRGTFSYKLAMWAGIIAIINALIQDINSIPTIFVDYYTAFPLNRFLTIQIITKLISLIFLGIGAFVAVGVFASTEFRRKLLVKIPYTDKIFVSAATFGAIAGINAIIRFLEMKFNLPLAKIPIVLPENYDTFLPFIGVLNPILKACLMILPIGFVLYSVITKKITPNWKLFALVLGAGIMLSLNGKTIPELLWSAAKTGIIITFAWFLIKDLLKDNVMFYISSLILLQGFKYVSQNLAAAGNKFYIYNGITAGVVVIILWIITILILTPRKE